MLDCVAFCDLKRVEVLSTDLFIWYHKHPPANIQKAPLICSTIVVVVVVGVDVCL